MSSILFRTGSGTVNQSISPGSVPVVRHGSFSSCEKFEFSPLKVTNLRRLNRAISEPKTISRLMSINTGSQTFPEMLSEVDEELLQDDYSFGSLKLAEKCFDRMVGISAGGIAAKEAQFSGVGSGSGRGHDGFGSGRFSGGSNNKNEGKKIGARYRKLLESNPNDPLLLRNYGKFLHEVEGDIVKAEEYYGRAILASPGDGELLSLYGKLIWEVHGDGERAQFYLDQAVSASPDDWYVISYIP
ncbi:putative tetratricopeptide-like helical domain superfamily [Helianthus annuus]|nr:putative tetratricopeptide-like helical domain superfamily [Helianthus annuus]